MSVEEINLGIINSFKEFFLLLTKTESSCGYEIKSFISSLKCLSQMVIIDFRNFYDLKLTEHVYECNLPQSHRVNIHAKFPLAIRPGRATIYL